MSFTKAQFEEFWNRRSSDIDVLISSDLARLVLSEHGGLILTYKQYGDERGYHWRFNVNIDNYDLDAFTWDSVEAKQRVGDYFLKLKEAITNAPRADAQRDCIVIDVDGLPQLLELKTTKSWWSFIPKGESDYSSFEDAWPAIWQRLFETMRVACVEREKEFQNHPLMQYTAPSVDGINLMP